ncbi:MAG: phosphate ABC transporter substrate-binding protein [Promethearchaeota archaeon]
MKKFSYIASATFLIVAIMLGNNLVGAVSPRSSATNSLVVDGSTTVFPIGSAAAEIFMDLYPDYEISVTGTGSGTGIASLISGTVDIAMASRAMKDSEKDSLPNWNETVVAKDGISVITHPSNPIPNLSLDEVRKIFNGTITDWSNVPGSSLSGEIVVINREETSGTHEFFWKCVLDKDDFIDSAIVKNSNGAVKTEVSLTEASIGYVGLGYVDSDVHAIKIDNVMPSIETVVDGTYPISRELYMYTDGEATGLAKYYIDLILSPIGQAIVEKEGFVPIGEVGLIPEGNSTTTSFNTESEKSTIPGYTLGFISTSTIFTSIFLVINYRKSKKV